MFEIEYTAYITSYMSSHISHKMHCRYPIAKEESRLSIINKAKNNLNTFLLADAMQHSFIFKTYRNVQHPGDLCLK
jgi:hypothetical protein